VTGIAIGKIERRAWQKKEQTDKRGCIEGTRERGERKREKATVIATATVR